MARSNDNANTAGSDDSFHAELAGDDFAGLQTGSSVHSRHAKPSAAMLSQEIRHFEKFLSGLGNGKIHASTAAHTTYFGLAVKIGRNVRARNTSATLAAFISLTLEPNWPVCQGEASSAMAERPLAFRPAFLGSIASLARCFVGRSTETLEPEYSYRHRYAAANLGP